MPSFNCDGCGDVIKKPKLDAHSMRCAASVTCLDCSTTFANQAGWKSHTSCISEAQKYEKSLYKAPKSKKHQQKQQPSEPPATPITVPPSTPATKPVPASTEPTDPQKEGVAPLTDSSLSKSLPNTQPTSPPPPPTRTPTKAALADSANDTNNPSGTTTSSEKKKKKKNKKNKNKESINENHPEGSIGGEQTSNSTAIASAPSVATEKDLVKAALEPSVAGQKDQSKAVLTASEVRVNSPVKVAPAASLAEEKDQAKATPATSIAGKKDKAKAVPATSASREKDQANVTPVTSAPGKKRQPEAAPAGQKDTHTAQPIAKENPSALSTDSAAPKLAADAPGAAAGEGPEGKKKEKKKRKREAQAAQSAKEAVSVEQASTKGAEEVQEDGAERPKKRRLRRKKAGEEAPGSAPARGVAAAGGPANGALVAITAEQVSKTAQGLVEAAAGKPLSVEELVSCVTSFLQRRVGQADGIVSKREVRRLLIGGAVKFVARSASMKDGGRNEGGETVVELVATGHDS